MKKRKTPKIEPQGIPTLRCQREKELRRVNWDDC